MDKLVAISKMILGVYLKPGQTELTSAELDELRETFQFFDIDGNGSVSKAELMYVLDKMGYEMKEKTIDKMIADVDLDGNGEIDFNEFLVLMARQIMAPGEPEELREAFKIFDKDKDGFISAEELRDIMTNLGEKFSDAEVDEMLQAADTNGDGRIDYMEFVKMITSS